MYQRKTLQELTISNNFLFGAVMLDENNCQRFLELALDIPIGHVEVSREKSLVYHPEYKGVRLDVFAKDENQTCFNVEMQVVQRSSLGKRSRYYHSHMDMEQLTAGREYQELPASWVIFLCDFDPFGCGKFRYTFHSRCLEDSGVDLGDERMTVFLSTRGRNPQEISKELLSFLNFVRADLKKSQEDFQDPYIKQVQESIRRIKISREMGERYMIFREMLQDERAEGRAEGRTEGLLEGHQESVLEVLGLLAPVPDSLKEQILSIEDPEILSRLLKKAARSSSLESFLTEAEPLLCSGNKSDSSRFSGT